MDVWERIKSEVKLQNTTQQWLADKTGIPFGTFQRWLSQKTMFNADQALCIAKALNTTVEYLFDGEDRKSVPAALRNCNGDIVVFDGEVVLVPILSQKVAAGRGQEILDMHDIIGQLPFLRHMLRGGDASAARALEVRGDSMTGINIFDGDIVVFIPGVIRGDGIYVLQVGDELIVKRVEFDHFTKKLRIMSENPRYPDRVELADSQAVSIVGKVYGWVHAHPY